MKALVTGATGFLGINLCRVLRERGWSVVGLGSGAADLRDPAALDGVAAERFDRIFHLAAWTQAGDFCLRHMGEQWLINQQINTTVLGWWHRRQPQAKLVSIGTSCAYEEGEDLSEDKYLAGTPIRDLYVYAMTKRMLLIGQQALHQQFGLDYLTVVPSTLYGVDYHLDRGKQMHFIFDLAWKILDHKWNGADIVLWGDGRQRRELVYVDDFIATMLQLDPMVRNEVVNIGAGTDHAIHEFAEIICRIVGVDPAHIRYDTTRYVGAKSKMLSNAKLDRLLPDRQTLPLEEGLRRTLAWLEPRFREGGRAAS